MSSINVVPTAAPAQADAQAEAQTQSTKGEKSSSEHTYTNDPSTLHIAPGVELSDLQRKHVALVLDIFQLHGSWSKMVEGFSEDAAYEDPFANAKNREESAGQLLHLPTVCSATNTTSYLVSSVKPNIQTTSGTGRSLLADEILVDFKHELKFKVGFSYHLDTTLVIMSDPQEGKIVRLHDRPEGKLPDNGLINFFRKMNGVLGPKVLGVPKDE